MKKIVYSLLLLIPLFTQTSYEHDFVKSQVNIIVKAAKGSSKYTRYAVLKALEYISANVEVVKNLGLAPKLTTALKNAYGTQAFLLDATLKEKHKNQVDADVKCCALLTAFFIGAGILIASRMHRTPCYYYQYHENAISATVGGASGCMGLMGAVCTIQGYKELLNFDQMHQEKLDNVHSIIAALSKIELA